MVVTLPGTLARYHLPAFFAELDAARDAPEVAVDFSSIRFSMPTGMLVAGSKLREWVIYRRDNGLISKAEGIDSTRNRVHSYLSHLGFFDFIHMDTGNRVGEARGGARYIPITSISRPDIDVSASGVDQWYAALEEEARRVAGVLAGSFDDSQALRTYRYAIREVIRNVFEHSEANECFVFGQRWANGAVEITIVDEGVGLAHTLSEAHGAMSDEDALHLAIRPGISRTSGQSREQNIYDNSGFGLYVLSELGASFGWFSIGSGSAFLYGHGKMRDVAQSSFLGTFFGLRFNTTPRDIGSLLKDIIDAGEREANLSGIRGRASGRSRIAV